MKTEYEPKSTAQRLGYLIEEAGEVQAAIGKSLRWGLDSTNPELTAADITFGETNAEWILRELSDLENAIRLVRSDLEGKR